MNETLPSPEILRKLLQYDPYTGKLFWRPRKIKNPRTDKSWNTRYAGQEAMTCTSHGYKIGGILGRNFLAHRVIFAMQTGNWPDCFVDHKNGNKSDNRWENIRVCTPSENAHNAKIRSDSTSGVKGVSFCVMTKRWMARIATNGKRKNIGRFDSKEEAERAVTDARLISHKDFARNK